MKESRSKRNKDLGSNSLDFGETQMCKTKISRSRLKMTRSKRN